MLQFLREMLLKIPLYLMIG